MSRAILLSGLSGLAALMFAPGQTPGQQTPPNSEPGPVNELAPVVVTGQRQYDRQQLEAVLIPHFIRSHGAATRIGQLARWRESICPTTEGLSSVSDSVISARVREIAANVGAPVKEPCEHNVQISFTSEPQKLVDAYALSADWVLGYHYASQRQRLITVQHPIQAWYATATRGYTGTALVDSEFGSIPSGNVDSRLTSGLSSEFFHVLVIVDLKKVVGYQIGQIADYVAMLVLSQPQSLEDCSDLPSILDLWSAACDSRSKPPALTIADRAYLKALYDINMEAVVSLERSEISNRMRQEIAAP